MIRSNTSINPSSTKHAHISSHSNKYAPRTSPGPASTGYAQADRPGDRYAQSISARSTNRSEHTMLPKPTTHRERESRLMQPQTLNQAASRGSLHREPATAVHDLLPYCTTEPPLNQEQVIAISDVAGSLQELVLLALSATSGNTARETKLVDAVGSVAANNIVEFFIGEWEVE